MKNLVIICSLVLILVASCQDKSALAELEKMKAQSELEEQNKHLAEKWHMEPWVNWNWAALDEICAPDIVIHNPDGSKTEGLEAVKGFEAFYEGIENIVINHYEIIAEGDFVLIRWDMSMDHTKEFMGLPATGNSVGPISGMDLFQIKDGKITDLWQNFDQLGFMQQLGAIPTQ